MAIASLRTARIGDRLPSSALGRMPARRLDATAVIVPGRSDAAAYLAQLEGHADELAEWDGRLHVAEPDGATAHRLLVVDRYRQVYAVHDAVTADDLPDPTELREWFRFLATACPECGVLDDPVRVGPTP
jgi:hypothetical protein